MTDSLAAFSQAGVSIWLDADSMQSLEDDAVVRFEASGAQLSDHLAETLRARPIQDRREP